MRKNTIIVISIAMMLSIIMSASVIADENRTYQDPEADVYVLDEESLELIEDFSDLKTTDSHPEVDIKKITYTKNDDTTKATIELEVYGDIEDKGVDTDSLDSLMGLTEFTIISYSVIINTTEQLYTISYSNNLCQLLKGNSGLGSLDPLTSGLSGDAGINITDYVKDGGKLTINFNLDDEDETLSEITAQTQYYSFDLSNIDLTGDSTEGDLGFEIYADMYPNYIEVEISGPSKAKVANKASFTSSVSEGNSPYEYQWDFNNDGEVDSTSANPSYTYTEIGNYTIVLSVEDSIGNIGEEYFSIQVLSADANINGEDGGSGVLVFFAIVILVIIVGIAAVFYVLKR